MKFTEKAKELSAELTEDITASINKILDKATQEENIEYIISSAIYNNVAWFTMNKEDDTFPTLMLHMMNCLVRDLPEIKEQWRTSHAK